MKKYLVILLIIGSLIIGISKINAAEPSTDSKAESKIDPKIDIPNKLKTLHNNFSWQSFMKDQELSWINYDLYRITSPKLDQNNVDFGSKEPLGYLFNNHNKYFCSTKIDKNCTAQDSYEYADIKASILLDQNIYTDKQQVAFANEVIKNITNPFPSVIALEMLNDNNLRKFKNKQEAFAETLVQQVRSGVARYSFNNMVLNRLSLSLLDKDTSANKQNFSKLSLMEQEAKSRFEDPLWHESIEHANQEKLSKELVKMEAFKIWMEYQKYKQNERIEALLATMVAEQSTLNQLLTEHKHLNGSDR